MHSLPLLKELENFARSTRFESSHGLLSLFLCDLNKTQPLFSESTSLIIEPENQKEERLYVLARTLARQLASLKPFEVCHAYPLKSEEEIKHVECPSK